MTFLSVDFETRSTLDLTKTGVYPYAEHPNTDILVMAYAIGDGPVRVWHPGDPLPAEVVHHIRRFRPLRAHNAQFERIIWRDILGPRYGFPTPSLEQWYCTAAEAAAMALPRSLGKAARVFRTATQKDDKGHRLMLQMCRPRSISPEGDIVWWDDEERMARLTEYCKTDVETERSLASRLRPLSRMEREVYLLDQKINDRGVQIDLGLVTKAQEVMRVCTEEGNRQLDRLTDGAVSKVTQTTRMVGWLQDQGLEVDSVSKDSVRDLLKRNDLPPNVREVLMLRQEIGGTSPSKLRTMQICQASDGTAKGLLLYHGASTGRWSGKLVQPQNFPRGDVKDAERFIPDVMGFDPEGTDLSTWGHPPSDVVTSLLRSMLIASPGRKLIGGDFSQIEPRVLGWLAGTPFRPGAYERMAAAVYSVPEQSIRKDSTERQVGKFLELGCGYQMGPDSFRKQLHQVTGIELSEDLASHAVTTYRTEKPYIPAFWREIEETATSAVQSPGTVLQVDRLRVTVQKQFMWIILPSGRPLAYAKPRIVDWEKPWGDIAPTLTYMSVNAVTRKWERTPTYGGKLTENVVQAIARDIMAEAMLRLETKGYPIVLTVHDEVISDASPSKSIGGFVSCMETCPGWAEGVELEVEAWEGGRYAK